jgi:hypothetical protein
MPEAEIDLLDLSRASVEAPAGCGKTELIVSALRRHRSRKPILVLTHTNSGVAALQHRLSQKGIAPDRYRLSTLDGWALRILKLFPRRSEIAQHHLEISNAWEDYPAIKLAIRRLLSGRHIDEMIFATYDRVIVDEYQDCEPNQHAVVCHLASILPTVVLGDPMQEIFNWTGHHPNWARDVLTSFPLAAELGTPWRWKNVGTHDLGQWLLDARHALRAGDRIDLRIAPAEVKWVHLDGVDDDAKHRDACMARSPRAGGEVLIMTGGRMKAVQRRMAKQTPGAVTIEAVDLTDVIDFARQTDLERPGDLRAVLEFAYSVMTGVNREGIAARVALLERQRNRTVAKSHELAAMRYKQAGGAAALADLLLTLEEIQGARTFRPDILRSCIKALQGTGQGVSFLEAAKRIREQQRILGRRLPAKAVGSPLLLKGLEGDVAVVLDATDFDDDPAKNSKNLYVAMTRGSRQLVVCSSTPLIG